MQSIPMDVQHYTAHPRNGHGVIILLVLEKEVIVYSAWPADTKSLLTQPRWISVTVFFLSCTYILTKGNENNPGSAVLKEKDKFAVIPNLYLQNALLLFSFYVFLIILLQHEFSALL